MATTRKKSTKVPNKASGEPDNSELDLQMPFMKLKMKHAKWPVLIVSIGLMFAIIIYAHARYKTAGRKSMIRSIAERFIKGKELTKEEVKTVESLNSAEREELADTIESELRKNEAPVPPPEREPMRISAMTEDGERLTVEQRVAPGTPVTIRKDGKKVEIRKGGPQPDSE